jgi:hypothetical protein
VTSRKPERETTPPWAVAAALTGVLLTVGATVLTISVRGRSFGGQAALDALPDALLVLPFTLVGVLLGLRRPRQIIGWLLAGAGTTLASVGAMNAWTDAAFLAPGAPGPFDPRLTLIANPLAMVGLALGLILVPALYPTGRSLTDRWRWIPRAAIVGSSVLLLTTPFTEDELRVGPESARLSLGANPFMELPGARLLQWLALVAFVSLLVLVPSSFASLVVRFRRADGVERQQLRWLRLGVGALLGVFLGVLLIDQLLPEPVPEPIADAVIGLGAAMVPVSIGIAILRHGLYEIDRVVNRAVTYGAVSTILGITYALLVVALQAMLPTGGSDVAVAGSTLAVAALFKPLRVRVRSVVERRFSRSRYDAARTVDAFAHRLRAEVDLDQLLHDLRTVTAGTLGASSVGMWLRPTDEALVPVRPGSVTLP